MTQPPGVDSAHAVWTLPFASWEAGASMAATVVSDPLSAAVVLDGDIDISTCPAVRRSLMAAISGGGIHLAVDMSGVTFIDASGIGVLVAAANRARQAEGGLSLLAPSRQRQAAARLPRPVSRGDQDADPGGVDEGDAGHVDGQLDVPAADCRQEDAPDGRGGGDVDLPVEDDGS